MGDGDDAPTGHGPGERHDPESGADHLGAVGTREVDTPVAGRIRRGRRLERADDVQGQRGTEQRQGEQQSEHPGRVPQTGQPPSPRPSRSVDNDGLVDNYEPKALSGSEMSGFSSSSTLTSLKVITRTFFTKRAGRYMSQTHASCISTSK